MSIKLTRGKYVEIVHVPIGAKIERDGVEYIAGGHGGLRDHKLGYGGSLSYFNRDKVTYLGDNIVVEERCNAVFPDARWEGYPYPKDGAPEKRDSSLLLLLHKEVPA